MEAIREYVRASANGRTPGAGHTGGLLLGQFDSTCRIAWVSQATGLPPGSTASSLKIKLGMDEVRDVLEDRSRRSGGMLTLVGFWHTHPGGSAAPSEEDRATMRELVASPGWPSGASAASRTGRAPRRVRRRAHVTVGTGDPCGDLRGLIWPWVCPALRYDVRSSRAGRRRRHRRCRSGPGRRSRLSRGSRRRVPRSCAHRRPAGQDVRLGQRLPTAPPRPGRWPSGWLEIREFGDQDAAGDVLGPVDDRESCG